MGDEMLAKKELKKHTFEELERMDDKTICSMLQEVASRIGEHRMPMHAEMKEHLGYPFLKYILKTGGSSVWSQRSNLPYRTLSLCWKCANAVPTTDGRYGCEWSRFGVPIEGWTLNSEPNPISYSVKTCPKFKSEKDIEYTKDDYVDDGFRSLGMEVIRCACTDYRDGIIKWLRIRQRSVTKHTLYRNKYRNLYGKTASPERIQSMWYPLAKVRVFLHSEYADTLSDYNCIYLADEIEKQTLKEVRWVGENPFSR